MDTSLIRELAELALAGSGQHCHEEALCIAEWLERLGQDEAARLIRISSLANQGRYQEALAFAHGNPWPALEPWFALCEWHLGLGAALDRRLAAAGRRLAGLENGALGERLLQRFAQPLQGLEADRLELKAMLRAELPLGRQQQTFLLQLLGAVEHAPGGEYLAQLARRELQVLIPLNGMLDNLVRNSHKLDLES
ncbi:type III secretion protein [Pseudomonas aeruginosa VRFPA09]|nr:type III secretion protein [Pseudomonas aeruginosa VRFPA09]